MLDIKLIRQNPDLVAEQLQKKKFTLNTAEFLTLDAARKQAEADSQSLQAERKQASKKIGELVKQGTPVEEAKKTVNETLAKIETQLEALKQKAQQASDALHNLMMEIPNIPDDDVPAGDDENANKEILSWGKPKKLDFEVRDHVDIGTELGGLDFDLASKLTGSRFAVMSGGMARLHRALTQFMLNTHIVDHGYSEIHVPFIVNAESLRGTGQLPKFADDLFKLEGEQNYYLIPTAEVPVTNIARDRILSQRIC